MTSEQENAIESLALEHGRVHVSNGFADGNVRLTVPNGTEYLIRENGHPVRVGFNFSIDWTQ